MVGEARADGLRFCPHLPRWAAASPARQNGRQIVHGSQRNHGGGQPALSPGCHADHRPPRRQERIRRRNTIAVVAVRQEIEHTVRALRAHRRMDRWTKAANGIPPLRVILRRAACICMPISQCPVW